MKSFFAVAVLLSLSASSQPSDAASYVTGQSISVDGGLVMH